MRIQLSLRPFLPRLRALGAHDQAQSLIELSLMVPVLFAVLIGMVELGRMAFAAIEVTSAAHSGALYGSQNLFTAVDTNGMKNAAMADAPEVEAWTGNAMQVSSSPQCSCTDGTIITCSNAGAKCISPARINMDVQVKTQATVNLVFFYSNNHPTNYTVYGQSIMRVSQ